MTVIDDTLFALLDEADLPADHELTGLLAELRSLGSAPVPAPSPELAALLVPERPRRGLHRRGAVVGALVVLSIGTGVTAAAASPEVRDGAVGAVAAVVHVLQPHAAVPVARHAPAPAATALDSRLDDPARSGTTPGQSAGAGPHDAEDGAASTVASRSRAGSDDPSRHSSGSDGRHDSSGSWSGRSGEDGEDGHGASGSGATGGSGSGDSGSSGTSGSESSHSGTGSSASSGSGSSDSGSSGESSASGHGGGSSGGSDRSDASDSGSGGGDE
jgi:hypothetical protein